jgi:hypothetical protein
MLSAVVLADILQSSRIMELMASMFSGIFTRVVGLVFQNILHLQCSNALF